MNAKRPNANVTVIGLTGSIAMGKTTIARQFAACGAAVCDSDAIVHRLLGSRGEAVEEVGRCFPATRRDGRIDRALLGKEVFVDAAKLRQLEAILHPLVRKHQDRFIRRAHMRGKRVVVLDIPLLFETQGEKRCDCTVVASAPYFLQRMRALGRMHMTETKFRQVLSRQMKNSEKLRRADFVVQTGLVKYNSLRKVKNILRKVARCKLHPAGYN